MHIAWVILDLIDDYHKGKCGIVPIIKLFVYNKGEFLSGNIFSTKQVGEGWTFIDDDQLVLKEIINLTKSDIPKSQIRIEENDLISKNNL